MAGHGVEATGEATHWYSCPRPVLKCEAVPALPANAVEGWLSQTPLDLETPASHSACMHPLETREPSHSHCLMGVYLRQAGARVMAWRAQRGAGHWQRMWSWGDGLQSLADDCRLSRHEPCPGGGARCSQCGPAHAWIAVPAHLNCRPLQLGPSREATGLHAHLWELGGGRGPQRGRITSKVRRVWVVNGTSCGR